MHTPTNGLLEGEWVKKIGEAYVVTILNKPQLRFPTSG